MAVTDAKTKGAKPPVGLGLTDIYRVCDPASLVSRRRGTAGTD